MVIDFGNNVVLFQTWTEFKAIVQSKSLQMQYADDSTVYIPFAIDSNIVYRTTIFKGTVPVVADVDQTTNDSWKTDFVNNFLPTANARIKDAVDTTGTATVGGTVNSDMRVGGTAVSSSNPVPMSDSGGSITVDGTFWQATQPVSAASLPLPTGAATEATLAALSAKLPATLGQTTNGNSLAVTIASNQTAVPVSDGGGSVTVDAVSWPLPTGASTAAKQPALGTAGTASTDVITVQGIASMTALKVDGSAVTQPVSGTVTANIGTTNGLALDATLTGGTQTTRITDGTNTATVKAASTAAVATDKALVVAVSPNNTVAATQSGTWNITNVSGTVSLPTGAATETTLAKLTQSQGSTTSGQFGPLVLGAVTTAAPTYTTAQSSPLSLTTAGALRTDSSGTTQPISAASLPLPTGAATQTTLASILTNTPALGQAAMASSSPVVIASNQSAIPVSQSGTWTVGGSGNFSVIGTATDNTTNSTTKLPVMAAVATTAAPTYTTGNMVPLSVDTSGSLRVTGSISATNPSVSTTGSAPPASATYIGGSVTTTAPTYTTGQMSALSLTTTGLLRVDGSGVTQPVSGTITANQGGTWNITNISGAISLPTGASTAALQTTGNTSLSSIDGKTPALGQTTMSASTPVVIASNQTAVPVSDGGGSLSVDVAQLPAALVGGRLDNNIGSWLGSTAPTVGQKTAANSIPVTFASDQTALNVSIVSAANTTPNLIFGDIALAAVSSNVAIRRTAYTEQTTNFTGSIVSSNANDTAAGTGARTVKIWYVDSTGTTAGTETVTLNGTTPVNLTTSTKCFIEDIVVQTAGSGKVNAGIITLKTGAAGAGTTVGTIAVGDNMTYWCHHYVVAGKTANITGVFHGNSSTVSGNTSFAVLRAKRLDIAGAVDIQVSDFVAVAGAANPFNRNYVSNIQVVGPSRVTMYVTCVASAAITYRGSFDSYE